MYYIGESDGNKHYLVTTLAFCELFNDIQDSVSCKILVARVLACRAGSSLKCGDKFPLSQYKDAPN